ncbi:MAG: response regulator [Lachnospiraceae bacterium]|jgi:signal transduction histidine kinase/ActR/RegA family two-component response regulator|nr:response regulator [Lachnospiraceae bacterium]
MGKKQNNSIQDKSFPILEVIKHYGFYRAVIFLILALFFTSLIIGYNTLLSSYARKSILQQSELNAYNLAKEVELYLSTGTDVINLNASAINLMIENNASDEELLAYVTEQTNLIGESILPESTGLYGYFNGKFYDGSGWVPEPDYDPTTRPWYTEAIADRDNYVLINPYLDMDTGEIVLSIAKALPDSDDVVSLDITLGRMQETLNAYSVEDKNTSRMIVSTNGVVVAHSDNEELGKNYMEETDSLGSYVLQYSQRNRDKTFDISYKGMSYNVCAIPINNSWKSISIVESRNIYRPLKIMVFVSILSILLTFAIFSIITVKTGKRTLVADNLSSILSSSADIYMSLCDLDVINNTVVGIKNVNPAIAKAVESCDYNMKELFLGIMMGLPDSPTKQRAIEFTDLSTIDERMKDNNIQTVEYLSYGDIWVRARLIVSERTPDGKVSHVLWMLENINNEKEERDKLIDISDRALAASEAKSAFLSNMSHEIRTPINAILGMNEMVLRECNDESIIGYSHNIQSAGNTLLGLVNDILDFSKIESGKMEIIPVDYDLATVLNDLVNMITPRLEAKGLELILEIDKTMPHLLHGDDVRIRQVITNILTNAAKYTEKGSVTLAISYSKVTNDNDLISLNVSVKDTGIGIKDEDMSKLFSEFERIEEKRNRTIEGTGLGMAITQSILAMMDSELTVKSVYGQGSEFSFELVQHVRDYEELGDYEEAFKQSVSTKEKYYGKFTAPDAKILVVDDTSMNILVFTSLLKPTDMTIDTAESGDEGIAYALKNKYDIIFLDHMMPKKDGIETLHELMEHDDNPNKDTPVICLTANAIQGAKEQYLEEGFTDYLTKPIDSQSLEDMIISYLPENLVIPIPEKPAESETLDDEEDVILPDFIFTIIDLNTIKGIKNCSGSEKLYMKALITFAKTMEPMITSTLNYKETGDMDDVLINIKTINQAAEMIGADWISNIAYDIEENPESEELDDMLYELFDSCRQLCSHLAPLL